MKEKQIKMNLIVNSVTIVLLATILFICTAFAWYVTNKTVSANGIGGASAVGNLHVTTHNIYKAELDENGVLKPPSFDETNPGNQSIGTGGLLSGDIVYYGVTLKSDNDVSKNLKIQIVGIDGGEWLTLAPVEATAEEIATYITATTKPSNTSTYSYYTPKVKSDGSFELGTDGKIQYVLETVNTYSVTNATTGKVEEFYFREAQDIWYKHVIYQDANGKRLNMMDVYKIQLSEVQFTESSNEVIKYRKSVTVADTANKIYPITNLVDTHLYGTVDTTNYSNNTLDMKEFEFVHDGVTSKLDTLDLFTFRNWNPTTHHEITLIFELKFDLSGISGLGIGMNSLSRNELSFDGMVIIGEDITTGGAQS